MKKVDQGKRDFLGWIFKGGVTALMASVLYPIYKFILPPASAEANISQLKLPFKLDDLSQAKEAFRIFKFGRDLGILVVTPDNEVKAFSALCTHLDCTVQYRDDMGVIWCACHNGHYDLEGRNIAGPPPRPLEQYNVHIDESTDDIFVSKMT